MYAYKKTVTGITDSRKKNESDNRDARYLLHIIESCIQVNDKTYLPVLIASVKDDLLIPKEYEEEEFSSVINNLDVKLSLMATELLRVGYSKPYLYYFFKSIKKNQAGIPFEDAFNQLQSKFTVVQQYEDFVIIRLYFPKDDIPEMENMHDEVPAEYYDNMEEYLQGFFKKARMRRFYIVREKAVDTYAALQKARMELSQDLDKNNLRMVHISDMSVVAYTKDGEFCFRREFYYGLGNSRKGTNILPDIMRQIDESVLISKDIKVRLHAALRHLRVGDDQTEIEQRFLNYWIGLEFIFSTPRSGDSTFSRIMEKFPTIKTLYYLKRNVSDLDSRLREKTLIDNDNSFGGLSEDQMDAAFNGTSDVLLKYRIKRMKSHLHNQDKVKEYYTKHIKNLQWHLSRIYYYRNELVHEAAIKHNIDGVTSNLRSYLVFMLNLLLDYCSYQFSMPSATPVEMDNFFWRYELLWMKYTPEYTKEGFLALEIPESIVK